MHLSALLVSVLIALQTAKQLPSIVVPSSYPGDTPIIAELSSDEKKLITLLQLSFPDRQTRLLPVLRAFGEYTSGRAICMIGGPEAIRNPELISNPVMLSVFRWYRLKGMAGPVKLLGNIVAAESFIERPPGSPELITGQSIDDLLEKLKRGRVDAIVIGPRAETEDFRQRHNLEVVSGNHTVVPVVLHCAKTDEGSAIIDALNKRIEDQSWLSSLTAPARPD